MLYHAVCRDCEFEVLRVLAGQAELRADFHARHTGHETVIGEVEPAEV